MTAFLDTHQHLVYPNRFDYSWTDDIPALAGRSFTLEDYRSQTADRKPAGSVFMETAVGDADYQAETRFVAEMATDPENGIRGLIASCRPETAAGFDAWLEECGDLPVVGFRRILHVMPDGLSETDTFRRNVRKIGATDRTFDLCVLARQLPIAIDMATACDNTGLVLDHCGVPDIAGGVLDPWRGHIETLAAMPHVSCKISGLLAYCASGAANLDAIRPFVNHVLTCFPADRLLWGGDWPVVNTMSSLPGWIGVSARLIEGLSDAEAALIGHASAERIYRLPVR